MTDYTNKVAAITGGASGIGYALAKFCCEQGMRVVIADWEEKALKEAEKSLNCPQLLTCLCDVSKPEQVEKFAQFTFEKCGGVDFLFNNAGVSGGGSVANTTLKDWKWMLDINLMGVVYVLHYFLPTMIERAKPAHIVNTSSLAGMITTPDMAPYNASKHAVVAISEGLCSELRNLESPVRVLVLCPSFIKTNILFAERNRDPKEAGFAPGEIEERLKGAELAFDDLFKDAMSPDTLVQQVFKSIEEERFYIFSHPKGSRKSVERRMRTILEDGVPYIREASAFPTEE